MIRYNTQKQKTKIKGKKERKKRNTKNDENKKKFIYYVEYALILLV